MNTIAKSEAIAVRLQMVCMALAAGSRERLDPRHRSDRTTEHTQHRGAPNLILGRQLTEPLMDRL